MRRAISRYGREGREESWSALRRLRCASWFGSFAAVLLTVALAGSSRSQAADCNQNGFDDVDDIAEARDEDCNANGVPDTCEAVPLRFGESDFTLPLSATPRIVIATDLDGDGTEDLVTGNNNSRNVSSLSVLFGEGGGSFQPERSYDARTRLSAVVARDVDGDGDVDVATTNSTLVLLFDNVGGGELAGPTEIPVPQGARSLAFADLDDNGTLDLITAAPGPDRVSWVLRQPGGAFGSPSSRVVPGRPIAAVPADFDGDGDVDLAIGQDSAETVTVLANDGLGNFTPRLTLAAGPQMEAVATTDWDGDGFPDLVAGHVDRVLLWRNENGEGFSQPQVALVSAAAITVADLNRDARPDLLTNSLDQSTVFVVVQDNEGSLRPPQKLSIENVSLTASDLDADGDVDIAVAADGPGRLTLLRSGEEGKPSFEGTTIDAIGRPHFLDVGDFDEDGTLDIVSANCGDETFGVLYGRPGGGFQPVVLHSLALSACSVAVDDFDGDGTDDVAFPSDPIVVYRNTDGGAFSNIESMKQPLGARFMRSAHLDDDGFPDIFFVHGGSGEVGIRFNDGRGDLSHNLALDTGANATTADVGDFDNDGDLDVAVASPGASTVSIFSNLSKRRFAPASTLPVVGNPNGIVISDFDRDGRADLATSLGATQEVALFFNQGDGTFGGSRRFALDRTPVFLIHLDIDLDGFTDLVTTNEGDNSISLLRGRGDGSLLPVQQFSVSGSPRMSTSADIDDDGDTDILVASRMGREVALFRNLIDAPSQGVPFLERLCTPLEFERLASPSSAPLAERALRFLLPASDEAPPPPLFINTRRFARDEEFLRSVFPERFGELTDTEYEALVKRRATREHFSGSVFRLRLDDGGVVFGFDVTTDDTEEELFTQEEVELVFEKLEAAFRLQPLVYFPRTTRAQELAASFRQPSFEILVIEDSMPPPPPPLGTPTFELEVPPDTVLCGVFAEAGAGRGPRQEYELKSRVRLRTGIVSLPTAEDSFAGALFESVRFGPDSELAEPVGDGEFRVTRIPGETATFRFNYVEGFVLPDGRRLDVEIASPLVYQARGEEPLQRRRGLRQEFFAALKGLEALQTRIDGELLVRYGSCTYETLTRWEVTWDLADGARARFEERYDEADSLFDTAPAALVRAELEFAGERRVVTEYAKLVYSASRHNTEVDYWVLLDPPVSVAGVGEVHAVELRAPEPERRPEAGASYLGGNLEELASVPVTSFQREVLPGARFLRGDTSGDAELNVVDALALLAHLFRRDAIPCQKAADTNDDGRLNIVDAVAVVAAIFGRGETPGAPFPLCGEDPTADGLSCDTPCVSG